MYFFFKIFINHYGFCYTKTSHDLDSLLSNRCQSEHLSEVGVSVGQARDLVGDQPGVLHTLRHPAQGGDALVVHQGHLHIDDLPQKIKYQNIPAPLFHTFLERLDSVIYSNPQIR